MKCDVKPEVSVFLAQNELNLVKERGRSERHTQNPKQLLHKLKPGEIVKSVANDCRMFVKLVS